MKTKVDKSSEFTTFTDIMELIDLYPYCYVCSYVTFCEELLSKEKEIKIFPNSRPWVTKKIEGFDL